MEVIAFLTNINNEYQGLLNNGILLSGQSYAAKIIADLGIAL